MLSYIFLITFVLLAIFNNRSRVPAFIMAASYFVYISFTNEIESSKLFYMILTLQELITGVLVALHYRATSYYNSKYIAQISFVAVFIHIYGRIVYQHDLDTIYYFALSVSVVLAQILLMIIRPLRNGLYTTTYRNIILCFNGRYSLLSIFKMPIERQKEKKCFQN